YLKSIFTIVWQKYHFFRGKHEISRRNNRCFFRYPLSGEDGGWLFVWKEEKEGLQIDINA
ncbi:MAG: hypothetical protein EGP82_15880, partial [Odoribacter splanchnicus]|nr:hypothetical protein [Odoribacter splanchnicus]